MNERIRNRDFADKREVLSDVPDLPAVTREAIEAAIWDAACVRSRESRLKGLLSDVLGIELGGTAGRGPAPVKPRAVADSHQ